MSPLRRSCTFDERSTGRRNRLLPQCRGVWLDRGELDKLLERAADAAPVAPVASPMQAMPTAPHDASGYRGGDGRDGRDGYRRSDSDYRKKKSWLNEIFD